MMRHMATPSLLTRTDEVCTTELASGVTCARKDCRSLTCKQLTRWKGSSWSKAPVFSWPLMRSAVGHPADQGLGRCQRIRGCEATGSAPIAAIVKTGEVSPSVQRAVVISRPAGKVGKQSDNHCQHGHPLHSLVLKNCFCFSAKDATLTDLSFWLSDTSCESIP